MIRLMFREESTTVTFAFAPSLILKYTLGYDTRDSDHVEWCCYAKFTIFTKGKDDDVSLIYHTSEFPQNQNISRFIKCIPKQLIGKTPTQQFINFINLAVSCTEDRYDILSLITR